MGEMFNNLVVSKPVVKKAVKKKSPQIAKKVKKKPLKLGRKPRGAIMVTEEADEDSDSWETEMAAAKVATKRPSPVAEEKPVETQAQKPQPTQEKPVSTDV